MTTMLKKRWSFGPVLSEHQHEGGQIDIAVTMVVRDFDPLMGFEPRFEGPEITWDVQDGDGSHLKTLAWNDVEGKWLEVDDPLAGLSVLDGGRVQG